jgi:hypothetical protein
MMGFRLLRSLFKKFSFIRWNFGYNEASHELLFHTMEFRLSQSLSRTLLSFDGISAITEPFHAIKAITEPFSNFHKFFLTMEFWLLRSPFMESRLSRSFSQTFTNSFSRWNSPDTQFVGRHFSYISQRVFT